MSERMMNRIAAIMALMILPLVIASCSGSQMGSQPILPSASGDSDPKLTGGDPQIADVDGVASDTNHALWGLWRFEFNSETGRVNAKRMRSAAFHMNIVSQLQAPMPMGLKVKINECKPTEGLLDIDITIVHPYPNSNLRAFDVRGILMGSGSTLISKLDPGIIYAAPDAMRITNADGYSRWWNAKEFTTPGLFGYVPGKIGFQDFVPKTTLNGYKYFSDALAPSDPVVPGVNPSNRGTFSTNLTPPELTRNYKLEFPVVGGSPIWFIQYAIDANWQKPGGSSPPPKPLDEYPPGANCPEAFHVEVKTEGTTAYYVNELDSGGDVKLQIEVFDWGAPSNPGGIDGEIYSILVESPSMFDLLVTVPLTSSPGSETTSGIYEVTIPDVHPSGLLNQEVLVTVRSKSPTSYISPIGFPVYPEDALLAAYAIASIAISPENPNPKALMLLKPNGSESWDIGSTQTIEWEWTGYVPAVDVDLSLDGGQTWPLSLAEKIINDGEFKVEPVGIWPTVEARIRVVASDNSSIYDISDENFYIGLTPKTITVTKPNGGETYNVGTPGQITWDSTGSIENAKILLSLDSGQTWPVEITGSTENDGIYEWDDISLDLIGSTCRIRIEDAAKPSIFDEGDGDFAITIDWIQLTSPNGGEVWTVGEDHDITWQASSGIENVKIDYSTDGGQTWPYLIIGSTPSDGVYPWNIPDTPSQTVRVRISNADNPSPADESNGNFKIESPVDEIEVLVPNGGEIWFANSCEEISWNSSPGIQNVTIILYFEWNEITSLTVAESIPNTGSFLWDPIPEEAIGHTNFIKVLDSDNPATSDKTDIYFSIEPSFYTIYYPNGGEQWTVGKQYYVTWASGGGVQNVSLDYSTDGGSTYPNVIAASTPDDGVFLWTIPDTVSEDCRVRVQSLDGPIAEDTSDADFAIGEDFTWAGWTLTWGGYANDFGQRVLVKSNGDIIADNFVMMGPGNPADLDPGPGIDMHEYTDGAPRIISKFDSNGNYIYGNGLPWTYITQQDTILGNGGNLFGTGWGIKSYELTDQADVVWTGAGSWVNSAATQGNALDEDNNLYISGYFEGTCDFYFGPGEVNKTSVGSSDIFLAKYESDYHELVWVKQWGGTEFANWAEPEAGRDVLCDMNGNLYVTGHFLGMADLDPGPGTDTHGSPGETSIFLSKFDYDGNLLWARSWGGTTAHDEHDAKRLCFDNAGNVLLVGTFSGTVDFDPSSNEYIRTSNGGTDAFLTKVDPEGNHLWTRTWGGLQADVSYDVSSNSSGEIFVGGAFKNSVDFDPDIEGTDIRVSAGGYDFFVCAYTTSGLIEWAGTCGGEGDDCAYSVAATSTGVCLTGSFEGYVDFDPTPTEDIRFAGPIKGDVFLSWYPDNGGGI